MQKPPSNLDQYEAKAFSQFGEDGISKYIFDKIKNDNYYFVEIGTQDGSECNTRYLRENLNWQGIQFDAKYENSLINLKKHMVTRENIIDIFKSYNIPAKFDYFSLDIDGIDWYILYEVLSNYEVRAFVCEYNACLGPKRDQVIEYDAEFWDAGPYNIYHGASLKAFCNLASSKGYSLVHSNGVNAFFINNKHWTKQEDFPNMGNLEELWKDYPEFLGYRFLHDHPTHEHANFNTSELLLKLLKK